MTNKKTSTSISSLASAILSNSNSSKISKQLAGSALAQSGSTKQTGAAMEKIASVVLKSDKFSGQTKKLAGTVLSQSIKNR